MSGVINKIKDFFRYLHIFYLNWKADRCKELHLNEKTVIIAPHPDDEVIGCGGLIMRMVSNNNPPKIIILTGGEGSHRGCCDLSSEKIKTERRKLTVKSLEILGLRMENVFELEFPDGKIDPNNKEMERLKLLIETLSPDSIFVPHWGEGWPDHTIVKSIVKIIVNKNIKIWEYCVWMWYYNIWKGLSWEKCEILKLNPRERIKKSEAINAYIQPKADCGRPWCGVLPELFIKSHRGKYELYFKND